MKLLLFYFFLGDLRILGVGNSPYKIPWINTDSPVPTTNLAATCTIIRNRWTSLSAAPHILNLQKTVAIINAMRNKCCCKSASNLKGSNCVTVELDGCNPYRTVLLMRASIVSCRWRQRWRQRGAQTFTSGGTDCTDFQRFSWSSLHGELMCTEVTQSRKLNVIVLLDNGRYKVTINDYLVWNWLW